MTKPRRDRFGRFNSQGELVARDGRLVPVRTAGSAATAPRLPNAAAAAPASARAPAPAARPGTGPRVGGFIETTGTINLRPTSRKGAKYSTWFKAMGTVGLLKDMASAESPDLLNEDLDEAAAPAAFYSNQSGILGRVKFKGIVPLEELIERLNDKLQFAGEEDREFDFRDAYQQWSYRYQVIETIGPTDRVITERRDGRPRRG